MDSSLLLDDLLQQRLAQLKSIANRRNDLLREMYLMMRRRSNVGQVFALPEQHEEQDLHLFLQRFDIREHLDSGSIANMSDNDLCSFEWNRTLSAEDNEATVPRTRKSEERDSTQKCSSVPRMIAPEKAGLHPALSQPQPRHAPDDESEDELDLFGSYHRKPSSPRSDDVAEATTLTPIEVINLLDDGLDDGEGDVDIDEEELGDQELEPQNLDDRPTGYQVPPTEEGGDDDKMSIDMDEHIEDFPTPDKTHDSEPVNLLDPFFEQEYVASAEGDEEMDLESDSSVVVLDRVSIVPEPFRLSPTYYEIPSKAPQPIIILAPEAPIKQYDYAFNPGADTAWASHNNAAPPPRTLLRNSSHIKYSLPPLKSLPAEYNRKSKSKQRKREKEKEKNDSKRDANRDDWAPMGINRWTATINANPLWKKVARSTKCLSSREWAVAMTELRLVRAVDRIEVLKDAGRWSFRQPKKQRAVGGSVKSHWDHLMDEMKWLRLDFREERKWKMALAFNLSTSVLEWHAAGSWSERFAQGIAVRWKRPLPAVKVDHCESPVEELIPAGEYRNQEHCNATLLGLDYLSDDDDEEEQDREVIDALQPSSLLEEAFETASNGLSTEDPFLESTLKKEELEDHHALGDLEPLMLDSLNLPRTDIHGTNDPHSTSGLKTSSKDIMLGFDPDSRPGEGEVSLSPSKLSSKANIFAPTRERVAYSDDQQLFLSLADLHLEESLSASSVNEKDEHLPPPDLSTIFSDLQPLALLDVVPSIVTGASEGRKKSEKRNDKDDPNRKAEDTTYSKLFPASRFMRSKPTLLGPLLPSKRWRDGSWAPIEEAPVVPEHSTSKVTEINNNMNDLFESRANNTAAAFWQAAALKDSRRKPTDHVWTASDDALLKSCIDKYPYNWYLIAECFNASRVTISTDKRSARDCLDRWREKWGSELKLRQQDVNGTAGDSTLPPSFHQNQITTRGVKRMASVSVASPTAGFAAPGPEPRKRRRHMLMQETIRKYTKKRIEVLQKTNAQRKPAGIHETHGQYAKMPKLSPADLIRLKAERDAREQQEILARKRHVEELGRQVIQARLSQQQNNQVIQQQQSPHQQPSTVPQPQLPGSNSIPRPGSVGTAAAQTVPQIRTQVNISQQQRLAAALATGNARLSPPQQVGTASPRGQYYIGGMSGEQMNRVMGLGQQGRQDSL